MNEYDVIYQIKDDDVKVLGCLMNYLNLTGLKSDAETAKIIEGVLKNLIGLSGDLDLSSL